MKHPITTKNTDLYIDLLQDDALIYYSTCTTPFGQCLVASTDYGICHILFFDVLTLGIADLQSRWPKNTLIHQDKPPHMDIKNYFSNKLLPSKIKLHLHGTQFQIKVWQALLSIPTGTTTTYGAIAKQLGTPGMSRAVGAAIGANPIGYIIPCHRVIKATGEISGYRWGVERKQAMLAWEAQFESNTSSTITRASSL